MNLYLKLRKTFLLALDLATRKNGVPITVNGYKLRVPGYYLRYFPKEYENQNFIFYKNNTQPGAVCLDIGAHLGLYSILMAKINSAKVFSFEPTPASVEILRKMVRLNHCEGLVTIVPAAIAGHSGKNIFYLNSTDNRNLDNTRIAEANSLVPYVFGNNIKKEKHEVNSWSIDDFAEKNELQIGFMKIDVEGAELEVLRGARKTLLKDHPAGILSIHPFAYEHKKETFTEIWNLMQDAGMDFYYNNEVISEKQYWTLTEEYIYDLQFAKSRNT
jgi:FkbM family methyltransferase